MGLELVHLVMDTEREFGIEISDSEARSIGTVGELYRFVLQTLEVSQRGVCPTQLAFYRVRQALQKQIRMTRQQMHPRLAVNTVIESGGLPSMESSERSLGLRLVPTRRSLFGRREEVPRSCETLGSLSTALASLNLSQLLGPQDRRVEIWSRLRRVIKNCLSLDDQDLLWQHHFVHDLGCG